MDRTFVVDKATGVGDLGRWEGECRGHCVRCNRQTDHFSKNEMRSSSVGMNERMRAMGRER